MKRAYVAVVLAGVLSGTTFAAEAGKIRLEEVAMLPGFKTPECVLYDAESGDAFVSNMESESSDFYWGDDGTGSISAIGADNAMKKAKWLNSAPEAALHSPKGMTILKGYLYYTDNSRLMRCSLKSKKVEEVASGFGKVNDLCTDGKAVWMSDTLKGEVWRISPKGKKKAIKAPEAINGLTFSGKQMFGVSWGLHEVYELDPKGKKDPVAFGLADHFTTLDAIEALDCGTFIVSDFKGNKLCAISPDRKTVTKLVDVQSPADVGLNREKGLLYVPLLEVNKVAIYRIR